jgi:hypothetical protein
MATDREGPVDRGKLWERLRKFYAYAFLPPSVTNDEFGGDSEAESAIDGPRKPPTDPRVVAGAADTSVKREAVELLRQYVRQSRDRADEFYEYAFLPPSYTNDDFGAETSSGADVETDPADFDGFVFTDWLDAARPTGPQKPPTKARVVTEAEVTAGESFDQDRRFAFAEWLESDEIDVETATQPTPEPPTADREYGESEFVEWLASGESGFEPIDIGEGPTEPAEPAMPESGPTTSPRLGIKPHPAKAATYALFLAVLTLAVLSVVGYAPVLGPATGLGG